MMEQREIRITMTEDMLGTCPSSQQLYSDWVLDKAPVSDDAETQEELETIPESGEKGLTIFRRDVDGIYLLDYQIKGFLKEAGNVLKDEIFNPKTKKKGIKALRSKLDNHVFVFPRYVWIAEDCDGILERPLRAMTAQGPRVSLARSEYIKAGIEFTIKIDIFPHPEISWEVMETILDYGRYKGFLAPLSVRPRGRPVNRAR